MTALPQIHPTVTRPLLAALVAAFAGVSPSQAALQTYTSDANTLHLYTFDEAAGGSVTANSGSIGGNAYTVQEARTGSASGNASSASAVTTMLGATGFSGFGNAVSVAKPVPVSPATYAAGNQGVGFDASGNGSYTQNSSGSTVLAQDALPSSGNTFASYFSGSGKDGSFTMEAIVNLPAIDTPWTGGQRTLISFESNVTSSRSMYLRIDAGALQLGNAGSFRSTAIPVAGDHAFTANQWFHAAVSYNAATTTTTFFWTKVDAAFTTANSIGSTVNAQAPANLGSGRPSLALGTDSRGTLSESLGGLLDNVRISDVARTADQFIFTAIPEPSSFAALAGLGTLGLVASRRRRSVC